mgnify:CR=1 FL=1
MINVIALDEYRRNKTQAANAHVHAQLQAAEQGMRNRIDNHSFSSSLFDVVERIDRLFRLTPDRTMFQAESELRDIVDYLEWLGDMAHHHEFYLGPIGLDSDAPVSDKTPGDAA